MNNLIAADYQTPLPMSRGARNHLLQAIIIFYQLHVEDFGEVKSLQVLREVLS